jgi:MtfA peptidase
MGSGNVEQFPWIFILFIIFIFIRFYFQLKNSEDPFIKRNFKRYLILRNLQKEYKPYLTQYFIFYNSLDEKNKQLFERRVQRFIDLKEFIPRGGLKTVTPEMKTMIAATAIQLTFGYPKVYFLHFWRILIYPDNYYSTITHKYHKGEVNVRGIIVLSWRSFKEGFSNPNDGKNLGFHEMAHALKLTNIVQNEEYDFYDRQIMAEFESEAHNETLKILNSPHDVSLFRDYCVSNLDEFFSVAVENFFEKPSEFRSYNIKLYTLLTTILKIDPYEIYNKKELGKIAS